MKLKLYATTNELDFLQEHGKFLLECKNISWKETRFRIGKNRTVPWNEGGHFKSSE